MITRRTALKALGFGFGATVVAPKALTDLMSRRTPTTKLSRRDQLKRLKWREFRMKKKRMLMFGRAA